MYLEYSYTASKTKITTNEELPPERAPNTWPEYVQEKKKPVKLLSYFDIESTSRSSKNLEMALGHERLFGKVQSSIASIFNQILQVGGFATMGMIPILRRPQNGHSNRRKI